MSGANQEERPGFRHVPASAAALCPCRVSPAESTSLGATAPGARGAGDGVRERVELQAGLAAEALYVVCSFTKIASVLERNGERGTWRRGSRRGALLLVLPAAAMPRHGCAALSS